jgi:hypothetical protein
MAERERERERRDRVKNGREREKKEEREIMKLVELDISSEKNSIIFHLERFLSISVRKKLVWDDFSTIR